MPVDHDEPGGLSSDAPVHLAVQLEVVLHSTPALAQDGHFVCVAFLRHLDGALVHVAHVRLPVRDLEGRVSSERLRFSTAMTIASYDRVMRYACGETEYATVNTKKGRMSSTNNDGNGQKPWRFVTNHTQVLLAIASDPDIRTREIAEVVGITERAAQRIVADLVESGHVESTSRGAS